MSAVQFLKKHDPALTARAVAEHVASLTPEAVERFHRDAQGRASLKLYDQRWGGSPPGRNCAQPVGLAKTPGAPDAV